MLKQRIEQDIRAALLARDTVGASVLRSLKSAITYGEVEKGVKGGVGLSDDQIIEVLAREAKKRQDSADAFGRAGELGRAQTELHEKSLIDRYLPAAPSEEAIERLVQQVIERIGAPGPQAMGHIISQVKQRAGPMVDGAVIAELVKKRVLK